MKRELHSVFIRKLYRLVAHGYADNVRASIIFVFSFHSFIPALMATVYWLRMERNVIWNVTFHIESVSSLILHRENLFEEMLQEKEDIAVKRKRCKEILRVLQQANWVCTLFLVCTYLVEILFHDLLGCSNLRWINHRNDLLELIP